MKQNSINHLFSFNISFNFSFPSRSVFVTSFFHFFHLLPYQLTALSHFLIFTLLCLEFSWLISLLFACSHNLASHWKCFLFSLLFLETSVPPSQSATFSLSCSLITQHLSSLAPACFTSCPFELYSHPLFVMVHLPLAPQLWIYFCLYSLLLCPLCHLALLLLSTKLIFSSCTF